MVDYVSAVNVGEKLSQIIPLCKRHLADGLWEPEKAVSFGILVCDFFPCFDSKTQITLSCSSNAGQL